MTPIYSDFTHSFPCHHSCRAYSYDTNLLPVYLAALRVIRVLRPVRAFRFTGLYVSA